MQLNFDFDKFCKITIVSTLSLTCLLNAQSGYGGEEKASPPQSQTVVPGILQKERTNLLKDIMELQKDGAGIKPYLNAFDAIELQINDGRDEKMMKPRIESLNQAIQDQLQRAHKHAWAAGNDPVWTPWARHISRAILTHWHPAKHTPSYKIKILFEIAKNGSLKSSKITRSSGIKAADDAALAAVKEAAPFDPWPAPPKEDGVSMEQEFTFNSAKQNQVN